MVREMSWPSNGLSFNMSSLFMETKDEGSIHDLFVHWEVLTTGLVAVMLLLGFGLVHIPRTMLREADPALRLHYALYKCDTVASPCRCPVEMHVSPYVGVRPSQ